MGYITLGQVVRWWAGKTLSRNASGTSAAVRNAAGPRFEIIFGEERANTYGGGRDRLGQTGAGWGRLGQAGAGWGRLQAEKNELSSNAEVM